MINILFGLASGGAIDNAAHLGGLAAGLWLGALVPPTGVPTLSSLWHAGRAKLGGPAGMTTAPGYVIVLGLGVVGVVVVAGVAFGTNRSKRRRARTLAPPASVAGAPRGQPARRPAPRRVGRRRGTGTATAASSER